MSYDRAMHRTLGTLLRDLTDRLDAAVQAAYREEGLDFRPRYTPVVRHLLAHGPSTLRAIAETAGTSHSAVSQTISEMLRRGLVEMRMGRDARERVVSLSSIGSAMLPQLQHCWERTEAAARSLDREVGADLAQVLAAAIEALDREPFVTRLQAAELALKRDERS